jgi:hypothetical protein
MESIMSHNSVRSLSVSPGSHFARVLLTALMIGRRGEQE